MKIEANRDDSAFKPVLVTITLETAEELKHLYEITGLNVTLPNAIEDAGEPLETKRFMYDLLAQLQKQIKPFKGA